MLPKHAAEPNLKTQGFDGPMTAKKDIRKGEELTSNYREFDQDAREGALEYLKKAQDTGGAMGGPHTWTGPDGTVYDVKKLWELTRDSPIEQVDIAPYIGRRTLKLRHRELGAAHEQRVQNADLSVPLLISHQNHRVDGNHRLAKALREGLKQLPARRLTEEQLLQGKLAALQTYALY